jgi:hypothetical protein
MSIDPSSNKKFFSEPPSPTISLSDLSINDTAQDFDEINQATHETTVNKDFINNNSLFDSDNELSQEHDDPHHTENLESPTEEIENPPTTDEPHAKFTEDRSFLQEHQSSSASKKQRMSLDTFQNQLAALTQLASSPNDTVLSPTLRARIEALDERQSLRISSPPTHRRSPRLAKKPPSPPH